MTNIIQNISVKLLPIKSDSELRMISTLMLQALDDEYFTSEAALC